MWCAVLLLFFDNSDKEEGSSRGVSDHHNSNDIIVRLVPSEILIMSAQGGGRAGSTNYTKEEMQTLLDLMEQILPIGKEELMQVTDEFNPCFPQRPCEVQQIHRKFNKLHSKQAPTGNPYVLEEVARAKYIHAEIGKKSQIGDGKEDYDIETGFNDEEADVEGGEAIPLHQPTTVTPETQALLALAQVPAATQNNSQTHSGVQLYYYCFSWQANCFDYHSIKAILQQQ